jgi:DNA-binding GntR family transcriptional regulator
MDVSCNRHQSAVARKVGKVGICVNVADESLIEWAQARGLREMETDNNMSETLKVIVEAFEEARRAGLPKVAQLYDAISSLIAAGKLKEGTKLPGERDLSAALKLSLGTAQRSLNILMNDGDLTREHGRGTFVRPTRKALRELWHYRFREPNTQNLLPVYSKLVERSIVKGEPFLVSALGEDPAGYVRITRLINIGGRFSCWSELFLGASRFRKLLKKPLSDVQSVNLKQILDREFSAPTMAVDQTAKLEVPSKNIAKALAVSAKTTCLLLQIVAISKRREPISFQKIYIPPVSYELELTQSPMEIGKSLAA